MRTLALLGGSGGIGSRLRTALRPDFVVLAPPRCDLDLTNDVQVGEWLDRNRPEVIVNCAGAKVDAVAHKLDHGDVLAQLEVAAVGLCSILRHALPYMREAGFGRVVHFSSVAAKQRAVGTSVYAAGKAFGETLIRVAAAENARKGVTLNVLRLGYFGVGMEARLPQHVRDALAADVPMGRWGTVEELARAIRFLVEAEYVTGSVLEIAGGL